jgi:hypothetical protein
VRMSDVAGGDAHFYRAALDAPGDRATLVWNRRAVGCIDPGCTTTSLTLSNLELEQLDPDTGAVEARSASAIDNVEQVRSPAAGSVIYKVKAASTVDGLPAEPYAFASRRRLTRLAAPRPTTRVSVSTDATRPGDTVNVVAEIANPSPDLSAEGATAAIELPASAELAPGSSGPTHSLGTLTPGEVRFVAWAIRIKSDAAARIRVHAGAFRYGEIFASDDSTDLTADGTPPSVAIAGPAGRTTETALAVAWSGTDGGSGVGDYDVEVSANDGPFTPWLTRTSSTAATYAAAAGMRYRFRVRARDRLGNASEYAVSSEVAVLRPEVQVAPPPAPPQVRTPPQLRIRSVARRGSRLEIRGTLVRAAYRAVSFDLRATARGRRLRRRVERFPVAGRFKLALRLPRRLTGTLTVRYAGDDAFEPAAARVRLRGI